MGSSHGLRLLSASLQLTSCTSVVSTPEIGDDEQEVEGTLSVTDQALFAAPLGAVGDTTLHSGFPYNNDGSSPTLGVTAVSVADVQRTILKFNQASIGSSIPSGNVLYSARIDLTLTGVSAGWLGESPSPPHQYLIWKEVVRDPTGGAQAQARRPA